LDGRCFDALIRPFVGRNRRLLAVAFAAALAVLLVAAWSPVSRAEPAQPATPAAPGVAFEPVGGGVVPPLVAAEAGVRLERARFAPGAAYAVPSADPSLLLVAVEEGALTVRSSAPLVVDRAAPSVGAGGAAREFVAAGAEVVLGVGDAFVRPPGSAQDLRNGGGGPAVALTASVDPGAARGGGGAATPGAGRGGAGLVVALAVVVVPECPDGYDPAEVTTEATPGGGGGGNGGGGVAVAIAAAPECAGAGGPTATPAP
jgi:hypothetical protein